MDAAQIQEVSDWKVCDAAANNLELRGQRYPVIEAEIVRRGISCDAHYAAVVSNCSMLQVTAIDTDSSPRGAIFTVANRSADAKVFRIYHKGIQSSQFRIDGGATTQFGVAVDPNVATLAGGVAMIQGGGSGAELNECRNVLESIPRQPPKSVRAQATPPVPAGPPEPEGMRTRTLRSVNLRRGAGTDFPIVRLLKEGESVLVRQRADNWCESVAGTDTGFVRCDFLAASTTGLASSSPSNSSDDLSFPDGTPYPQVRRRLLDQRWQPFRPAGKVPGCGPNDACMDFPETVSCYGASSHACGYAWQRGEQYLLVIGIGEVSGQFLQELRQCSRIKYSGKAHPRDWCE